MVPIPKSSSFIFIHNNHSQEEKGTGTKSESCSFSQLLLAFVVPKYCTQVLEKNLPQLSLGNLDFCLWGNIL